MAFLADQFLDSYCGLVRIRNSTMRQLLDLQYRSICLQLKRAAREKNLQSVLDVGSGGVNYRTFFPETVIYKTVDPMGNADLTTVEALPRDEKFDVILLIEVLEHAAAPESLLRSLQTRLNPGGELWLSVPFAARIHRVPEDYWRWTDAGLRRVLRAASWDAVELRSRGGDLCSWAARLNFWTLKGVGRPLTLPWALLCGVFLVPPFLLAAHLSLYRARFMNSGEPLGFFARAIPLKSS